MPFLQEIEQSDAFLHTSLIVIMIVKLLTIL